MIKLTRPPKPTELTPEKQAELTEIFKNNKEKAVWKQKFIAEALFEMSYGKCCFSEMRLNQEGKYMEVEHFYHKSDYPDEVVEWENLLPCSRFCNGKKGTHDTKKEPIINPVEDNPKEHLYLKNYRFKGKTELGKLTIDIVGLNNRQHLVTARFEIGDKTQERLADLLEDVQTKDLTRTQTKNRVLRQLENLMREAIPEAEYSATVATVILNDENYHKVKKILKTNNLWNDELTNLETQMQFCELSESRL